LMVKLIGKISIVSYSYFAMSEGIPFLFRFTDSSPPPRKKALYWI
jgi:hypothetical protein